MDYLVRGYAQYCESEEVTMFEEIVRLHEHALYEEVKAALYEKLDGFMCNIIVLHIQPIYE